MNCKGQSIVVQYPDRSIEQLAIDSSDPSPLQAMDQRIEILSENPWSRESNLEIFISALHGEGDILQGLLGTRELDPRVARMIDEKLYLVISNIKLFLVAPR